MMGCKICGADLVWRGSMARGSHECPRCQPADKRSATLDRYYAEVNSWHRSWCNAVRKLVKGRTDPALCDCGHTLPCPHSEAQIEQRERAAYGDASD